jgi:hypothetical protein
MPYSITLGSRLGISGQAPCDISYWSRRVEVKGIGSEEAQQTYPWLLYAVCCPDILSKCLVRSYPAVDKG